MKRKLVEDEMQIIRGLISGLDDVSKNQVLQDLNNALAFAVTPSGSRLQFEIPNYQRPPYHGQHPIGGGGVLKDFDGADVEVSLYADENNRVLELEFVRWGNGALIKPDLKSFQCQF